MATEQKIHMSAYTMFTVDGSKSALVIVQRDSNGRIVQASLQEFNEDLNDLAPPISGHAGASDPRVQRPADGRAKKPVRPDDRKGI